MNAGEAVLVCDQERRRAMIAADAAGLAEVLADDLTWTHSSGATETKAEFIAAISSGSVSYETLEIELDQLRGTDTLMVHNGLLRGRAARGGQAKALNAKFLAVWRAEGEQWRLCAWQSTNCSD